MGRREGIRGRRRPVCRSGLLITVIILSCVMGLHAGCANDPYSQRRIEIRRAHIQQTFQAMEDHEAAAGGRMRYQVQRIGDWYQEDQVQFRERMRTAGNNIW